MKHVLLPPPSKKFAVRGVFTFDDAHIIERFRTEPNDFWYRYRRYD